MPARILGLCGFLLLFSGCPDNRDLSAQFMVSLILCSFLAACLCLLVNLSWRRAYPGGLLTVSLVSALPALFLGVVLGAKYDVSYDAILVVALFGFFSTATVMLISFRIFLGISPKNIHWAPLPANLLLMLFAGASLVTNAETPIMLVAFAGIWGVPPLILLLGLCLEGVLTRKVADSGIAAARSTE